CPPASAHGAGTWAVGEPRPAIRLTSFGRSQAATFKGLTITTTWTPVVDLFNSAGNDKHFVVEVETDGAPYLRFGDGTFGQRPVVEDRFLARYRIGNGIRGNVGAGVIAHLASADPGINDQVIVSVSNPLPSRGGADPETIEQTRRAAPSAFRV